jgi:hypothetical protein
MIPADTILELHEISDPSVVAAVAKFIHAARCIADANDPRVSSSGGGHTNKPGSRPPGREQCAGAVRRLTRLAQDADNEWGNLTKRLERESEPIESMGGIQIREVHAPVRRHFDPESVRGKLMEAAQEGARDE